MIPSYTAFAGEHHLASGPLSSVAVAVLHASAGKVAPALLVFNNRLGQVVDLDLRGSADDVARANRDPADDAPEPSATPAPPAEPVPRKRGRPKLGVIAREITLLPRHWDWLRTQRGGASSTLRRLVDMARKDNEVKDRMRQVQGLTHAFMSAMLGDSPGFEEAMRALYAGDRQGFASHSQSWPADIRDHARLLSAGAFADA